MNDCLLGLENIPKSARISDSNLLAWITLFLDKPKKSIPLIRLTDICRYSPSIGFMFSIDSATNLDKSGTPVVLNCLSQIPFLLAEPLPECKYPNDITYTKNIVETSRSIHPFWDDGARWFRNRIFDPNAVCILQVYDVTAGIVVQKGWTPFPIFRSSGYVRHGVFQLPIFEGEPSKKAVDIFLSVDEARAYDTLVSSSAVDISANFGSLFIRISDARRWSELSNEIIPTSTLFLGKAAYKFKRSIWSISPYVSSVAPKSGIEGLSMQEQITELFSEKTGVKVVP